MIVCVIDKEVEHIIQIEMNEYGGTMTNPLKGSNEGQQSGGDRIEWI
jgi:hypothetical protein